MRGCDFGMKLAIFLIINVAREAAVARATKPALRLTAGGSNVITTPDRMKGNREPVNRKIN